MSSTQEPARRRPDWATVPNAVTLIRFGLLVPVCYLLVTAPAGSLLAVVLLVVWASTDWIDGFLARRLHQVSRTGEVMDPIADRLGIGAVVVCLAVAGSLSWWAVGIILGIDLVTASIAGRAAARGQIHVRPIGKVRTAVMFFGIAALVAALTYLPGLAIIGSVLIWIGVVLHVVAGAGYVVEARNLRALPRG